MPGAGVDVDLALRVGGHAAHFADEDVERRAQQIGVGIERDLWDGALGADQHAAGDQRRGQAVEQAAADHRAPPWLVVAVGLRMIFCDRQSLISAVKITFGSRQSIWWMVANSPGALPALPNLPTMVPSSSIL